MSTVWGGDAFGTWRDSTDDANLWPRWLGEEVPDVGTWSLGYAASPSKLARLFNLVKWLHTNKLSNFRYLFIGKNRIY